MEFTLRFLMVITLCAQGQTANDAQTYFADGNRALASGHYSEAETNYVKLRQIEPGVAEVHMTLSLIYFQEGKFSEAVPELQRALQLKLGLTKVEHLLAMSQSELGRYNEALPGLEKGFRQSGDVAMKRMCGLQLTRAYTALDRDSEAVETALALDHLYPHDPEVLYHTSKIYGNSAFLNIQKLAQVAPDSVWKHLAAAEADESQGATDAAIGEYREVLRLNRNRPNIHFRIGRTLLARWQTSQSQNDLAQVTQEFEQELSLDPANANAAYELAEIHRKAGQFDQAQQFFEQAIKHYPDFGEARLGIAGVLMTEGKPSAALPQAQKATELEPENEVAWYRLAQAERHLAILRNKIKPLPSFRN